MIRTYYVGGDAFCEIIRNEDDEIINLKPLDPGSIRIVADRKGLILRYEKISKIKKDSEPKEIKTKNMFHLARNRIADEIHGVSVIRAVENIILARNEAISDYKQVMHRFVKPRFIFHLDTDDTTEIATFKAKMDKTNQDGENIYVPKDVVVPEVLAVAPNSTLNPKAWIEMQGEMFYEAVGTPRLIIGGAKEFTDGAAKTRYLAWQQDVEEEQLFIEEQVGMQLGVEIELEFPASIENDLLSDKKKDANGDLSIQPNETTAGRGQ